MRKKQTRQQGVAILLALLIMALLATLASVAITTHWAQQRTSVTVQQNMQQDAIVVAAQQWGHAVLVDDAQHTKTDNLNEAWATPMPPAPLAAFLKMPSDQAPGDATVSNRIEDLSGKWNISSLRRAPPESQHHLLARKIAADAGLDPERLIRLVASAPPERPEGWLGGSSALRSPQGPEACLRWLGLSADEVARTQALLTCLPDETALNINTVDPKFFKWLLDPAIADETIKERAKRPFNSIADAAERLKKPESTFPLFLFGNPLVGWSPNSSWFAIHTQVTIDGVAWGTTQTVHRLGSYIQTLSTTNNF